MPPSRLRALLSLAGLAAVAASLYLSFTAPFGIWNWVLLLVAGLFLGLARRVAG